MKKSPGKFIISLDLELGWGSSDWSAAGSYAGNIQRGRAVIPEVLDLFTRYEIHTTWAAVGFLFFPDRENLLKGLPLIRPEYDREELSSYSLIPQLGRNEGEDPLHYGAALIETIRAKPYQEIGTHTLSHYYCLAAGQNRASFQADLRAAKKSADRSDIKIESIVFPRHQANPLYLPICRKEGIIAYRGINDAVWMYRAGRRESLFSRIGRLLDTYLPISGCNAYRVEPARPGEPVNVRESRFLRPCLSGGNLLEQLRLRRILTDLSFAAVNGLAYHLWWHPHNFGAATDRNLAFLRKIFDHYQRLRKQYGMVSRNMSEVARDLISPPEGII